MRDTQTGVLTPGTSCLVAGIAALAAGAFVLLGSSLYGMGVTPDSIFYYLAAAKSLAAGKGFGDYAQPPLLPALLAVIGGADMEQAARYLNAAMLAALLFIAVFWVARSRSLRAAVAIAVLLLFSNAMQEPSLYLWTEMPFLVSMLAGLYCVVAFIENPSSRKHLLGASVAFSFCVLARYIGAAVAASAALCILLFARLPVRKRLAAGLLIGVLPAVSLGLWFWSNWQRTGTLTGPRFHASATLASCFSEAGQTVLMWFWPVVWKCRLATPAVNAALLAVAMSVLAAAAAMGVYRLRRRKDCRAACCFVVGGTYFAALVYLALNTPIDSITGRLMGPLWLLAALAMVWAFSSRKDEKANPWALRAAVAAGLLLWAGIAGVQSYRSLDIARTMGAGGYNDRELKEMQITQYVRANDFDGPLLSNDPGYVTYDCGKPCISSPLSSIYRSQESIEAKEIEALRKLLTERPQAYLVWLKGDRHIYNMPPKRLAEFFELRPVEDFPEGTVYRVSQRPPP